MPERRLTHFDESGRARMVDVSGKPPTERVAVAEGRVTMRPETLARVLDRNLEKGDVLGVARVAAIMAAKRTADIIPLCHPLAISSVDVEFYPDRERSEVAIQARVTTTGKTGVEMEALTAAAAAGLTIYDMCKAVDREMVVTDIRLIEKRGGASGVFRRKD